MAATTIDIRFRQYLELFVNLINSWDGRCSDLPGHSYNENSGEFIVLYDKFLFGHDELRNYLKDALRRTDVKSILESCQISKYGGGNCKKLRFFRSSLERIKSFLVDSNKEEESCHQVSTSFESYIDDNHTEEDQTFSTPPATTKSIVSQDVKRTEYCKRHERRTYSSSGASEIGDFVQQLFHQPGWNKELKKACGMKLIDEIQSACDIPKQLSNDKYKIVCSSVNAFVKDLKTKGNHSKKARTAIDTIISASTYSSNDVSSKDVQEIIGVSRNQISKIRQLNLLDSDESSDDAVTIIVDPTSELAYVSDEPIHSDESAPPVSDVPTTESDNDESSAMSILETCNKKKKERSDKVDDTVARRYWHSDHVTQYDTNTNKHFTCFNVESGTFETHRQRLQSLTTKEVYQQFVESEEYLQHLNNNSTHTIGFRLFQSCKCNCIKWDKWRKCADTKEVEFKEFFRAQKRRMATNSRFERIIFELFFV